MLQVYDRVLTSRSLPTLVGLTVLMIGAYAAFGLLDLLRGRAVSGLAIRLDREFGMIDRDRLRDLCRRAVGKLRAPADIGPYAPDGVRPALIRGLAVVGVLVFGGGIWAGTASLSGAVLAPGTVVVESSVKKVQHATGGTVAKIFVTDGDRVEQGAILLKLDETITRANLQIITKQLDELAVRKMRLIAERDGAEALSAPPPLQGRLAEPDIAALTAAERRVVESRRDARMGQKAQLRERMAQLHQEADGLAAQQWAKGNEINRVSNELEGAEKLWSAS